MLQMEDKLYSGEALKKIRTSKGVRLQKMAEETKVTRRHLENIEEENFFDIPAKIYLKSFLTSYARHLGINEEEVLRQMLDKFDNWKNKNLTKEG